ncbi:MAG TPA: isoprenylcysteine carboxylmethyltransferase family protein [Vicinamibacterales bacterium]
MSARSTPEVVAIGLWIAWLILWWLAALWRERAAKQPPPTSQIMYRVLTIIGAVLLFQRIYPPIDVQLWRAPDAIQWSLVGFVVAGLAFTWWARVHLGRLWSSNVGRKADHRIVDTGPYGVVRHPIYTGIMLAAAATAALRATVGAWIGMALVILGSYIKARLEERFLREQLGAEQYDGYAARVPMLVPRSLFRGL